MKQAAVKRWFSPQGSRFRAPRASGQLTLLVPAVLVAVLAGSCLGAAGPEEIAAKRAAAEEAAARRELQQEFGRLRQHRFYRQGTSVFDNITRLSQIEESKLSFSDRFLRAFYEGRWEEIRTTLEALPREMADTLYDKMLEDLTGRNVPVLILDDLVGLADACPSELTTDRIRKCGALLRIAVVKEQEVWLKQALEKGTRRLGRGEPKQLATGRVLMEAGFGELAREYLPSAREASQLADEALRDEIMKFLASQEELAEFQQNQIAAVWREKAKVLADPKADWSEQQQAVDRLADILSRAPSESIEPWIRGLMREDPAGGLRLASALGRGAQSRSNDSEVTFRTNNLKAQKCLLLCASDKADLAKAPWNPLALAMADWWIREAEHTFENHPTFRTSRQSRPAVAPGDVLDSAPSGAWAKALPASLRERVDMCLSRAVLVSDRSDDAVALIVDISRRNRTAGVKLAEEYLQAWAYRHNPQIPEEVRKKQQLPEDARIMVTPIMMEKNVDNLAKMMDVFRKEGVHPKNGKLLVDAFEICYSKAEVYRKSHIERVFGAVEAMDEEIFLQMIRTMTAGLASRWRTMDLQKESGTRRTQAETLGMVREGYQAAIDMMDQRCKKQPDAWRTLALAGSLLSDWGDFECYQELAAEPTARRMELFREKNNQAEERFTGAAEAYARELARQGRGGVTIDVYLAWFHSLLGINTGGDLNLSKALDRRALNKIRDMIRSLPKDAGKAHLDKLAKFVNARLEDTDNPLHEEIKYKYLAGSLVITRDSPFSFQASNKVSYYDELLGEVRLETRVDGPSTVQREQPFGMILSVHHTEAMGRMADFGKYLVNEGPPPQLSAWQRKQLPTPVTVHKTIVAKGRRDELEIGIREALSLFFDIESITFSPRDVQPRPTERAGWQETVLAYLYAKAKDSSVDKIPRIQLGLEFMDLSGPVTVSAESAETMIKVTDRPTPPRPYQRVDLTQVLDARNLVTAEEALLEVAATASGIVPELDHLLDLEALRKQLPIARIDPHEGTHIRQVNSWGDGVQAVSERRWTLALDARAILKPPRRIRLELPAPRIRDVSAKYQAYRDMDLVDLSEPVAAIGPPEGSLESIGPVGMAPWVPYAAAGGGLAVLLLAGVALAWLVRGRGERPLRAKDVFHMPGRIDGFVVVQLLRALGSSNLVRLTDVQRAEMREEMEQIQKTCFANGNPLPENELQAVARKWLKIAC